MANPICLSPLKFYDALEKQERYKSYAYGSINPVVMPFNIILPFQFTIPRETHHFTSAILYDADTNTAIKNVLNELKEIGLTWKTTENCHVVMMPGIFPLKEIKQAGQYYIRIATDLAEYYSEVFCFTNSHEDYIEIEYWNQDSDFLINNGVISFANGFHFKILIKSELGKPEYIFEEEATSKLGYTFVESQISKKVYKFNAILPEYICDALRIIRMCSDKKLTCKGETYNMLSFEMDVDWQEQGDLASVNCEFEVDNIIANIGGFMRAGSGDFNQDYNNDFNKDYKK